jgi:DNA-binding NarL/FixJ family response regulator
VKSSVSVIVVDDHALVRETVRERVAAEPDIQVLAVASDARDALRKALEHRPDIVLMDIDMPGLLCFDAARSLLAQCPQTRVVFVSAFFDDRYIEEALAAGASGYVTKNEPPEALLRAIRSVASGAAYFSPEVRARIVIDARGARLGTDSRSRASTLTRREKEVLRYLARGMSKREIAETICVSVKTVDHHVTHIMQKLDIQDRVQLARFAIREGFEKA